MTSKWEELNDYARGAFLYCFFIANKGVIANYAKIPNCFKALPEELKPKSFFYSLFNKELEIKVIKKIEQYLSLK
jgi:hypothetical protein